MLWRTWISLVAKSTLSQVSPTNSPVRIPVKTAVKIKAFQVELNRLCFSFADLHGDAYTKTWKIASGWNKVMKDIIRPMIEADAAKFAKENNITPRDCSKEG